MKLDIRRRFHYDGTVAKKALNQAKELLNTLPHSDDLRNQFDACVQAFHRDLSFNSTLPTGILESPLQGSIGSVVITQRQHVLELY